jgi:hypothetical protein
LLTGPSEFRHREWLTAEAIAEVRSLLPLESSAAIRAVITDDRLRINVETYLILYAGLSWNRSSTLLDSLRMLVSLDYMQRHLWESHGATGLGGGIWKRA